MVVYYKYPHTDDYIAKLTVFGNIEFTPDGIKFRSGGRGYLIPFYRIVKIERFEEDNA